MENTEYIQLLKNEAVKMLSKGNLDEPCLRVGRNVYTKRQLIEEVENDTEQGVRLISNMCMLALDLMIRDNTIK